MFKSWARRHHCSGYSEFQGESGPWGWREESMGHGFHRGFGRGPDDEGGGFGVRRPLRFLAHKLGLDEGQITQLARILDELKTERAQGAVDDRRTLAEFADAVGAETFDAAKAAAGADRRVAAAQRLKDAIVNALGQIHAVLNPGQRARLAYFDTVGRAVDVIVERCFE